MFFKMHVLCCITAVKLLVNLMLAGVVSTLHKNNTEKGEKG